MSIFTDLSNRISKELFTVSRFTLVGIIAAAIHIGLVTLLVSRTDINAFVANLGAFLCAFAVSFTGQYLWTFRSARRWRDALGRFFFISSSAFGVNNLLLFAVLDFGLLERPLAVALSACIIPALTYAAGRLWAF